MFNSPILDITIGLVFIFLLYSLLATSINEAIATVFALRARMLRNAIVENMLSNTPTDSRLTSMRKGIVDFFMTIPRIFIGRERRKGKIGDQFFEHPIIKHYGSTRVFAKPSYLSARNFSTITIDILQKDFQKNLEKIAAQAQLQSSEDVTVKNLQQNLKNSPDIDKILQLIHYYKHAPQPSTPEAIAESKEKSIEKRHDLFIDPEVLDILEVLLKKSNFDLSEFQKQLETWYDDTMDRVSGWYKRQTQSILFCLGLFMAMLFNLDTIGIVNKLSTNTDARKIVVAQAISYAEQNKTNPQTQRINPTPSPTESDTAKTDLQKRDSIKIQELQKKLDGIKDFKKKEIDTINTLLALGWGDYGVVRDSAEFFKEFFALDTAKQRNKNMPPIYKNSTPAKKMEWLKAYYDQHSGRKFSYVRNEIGWRKFIGFLITAFAISLGAPFWFDMLNKVIKVRGTGAKENRVTNDNVVVSGAGGAAPIIINNHLTEEAQG